MPESLPPAESLSCRPRSDCAHYRGDLPCIKKKVCWACDEFIPLGRRALVIKFGAPGDALRTTPVLSRLRREGFSEVTWICDAASREILSLAPGIDRLVVHDAGGPLIVATEQFDLVLSLDKDPAARALASLARSEDRRGFTTTPTGRLEIFDDRSAYALRLGMDDELKFHGNTVTVPAMLFAMCGWDYRGEPYALALPPGSAAASQPPSSKPIVALNVGCGTRWPTKAWPEENWAGLARLLQARGVDPVFVGGEAEREMLGRCAERTGARALPPAPVIEFARFLATASCVVSADSLGMHVALALGRPVIGLFCSTVDSEIEWFGLGEAMRGEGGPCYNPRCGLWPGCMNVLAPSAVAERVQARMVRPVVSTRS